MSIKLNQYEKGIITVELPEEEEAKKKGRGIIEPPPIPDYLGRRLQSILIYARYFDLGWLVDGSDLDFTKLISFTRVSTDQINLGTEDYTDDLISLISGYNLETDFKEITGENVADYYSTNLSGEDSGYTDGKGFALGLKGSVNDPISVTGFYEFEVGLATNNSTFKVTAELDYDAEEVEITLDQDVKVFILPRIFLYQGGNLYRNSPGSAAPSFNQILGLILRPFSRNLTINNSDFDMDGYIAAIDAYMASTAGNRWLLPYAFNDDYHFGWIDHFVNLPGMRLFVYKESTYGGGYTLDSTPAPSAFVDGNQPFTFNYLGEVAPHPWWFKPWVGIRPWRRLEGQLRMIIKQGENTFYVWNKLTTTFLENVFNRTFENAVPVPNMIRGGIFWEQT